MHDCHRSAWPIPERRATADPRRGATAPTRSAAYSPLAVDAHTDHAVPRHAPGPPDQAVAIRRLEREAVGQDDTRPEEERVLDATAEGADAPARLRLDDVALTTRDHGDAGVLARSKDNVEARDAALEVADPSRRPRELDHEPLAMRAPPRRAPQLFEERAEQIPLRVS